MSVIIGGPAPKRRREDGEQRGGRTCANGACVSTYFTTNRDGSCWADSSSMALLYPLVCREIFQGLSGGSDAVRPILEQLISLYVSGEPLVESCPKTSPSRLLFNAIERAIHWLPNIKPASNILPNFITGTVPSVFVSSLVEYARLHGAGDGIGFSGSSTASLAQALAQSSGRNVSCVAAHVKTNEAVPVRLGTKHLVSAVVFKVLPELTTGHAMAYIRCNESPHLWLFCNGQTSRRALLKGAVHNTRNEMFSKTGLTFSLDMFNPFDPAAPSSWSVSFLRREVTAQDSMCVLVYAEPARSPQKLRPVSEACDDGECLEMSITAVNGIPTVHDMLRAMIAYPMSTRYDAWRHPDCVGLMKLYETGTPGPRPADVPFSAVAPLERVRSMAEYISSVFGRDSTLEEISVRPSLTYLQTYVEMLSKPRPNERMRIVYGREVVGASRLMLVNKLRLCAALVLTSQPEEEEEWTLFLRCNINTTKWAFFGGQNKLPASGTSALSRGMFDLSCMSPFDPKYAFQLSYDGEIITTEERYVVYLYSSEQR